MNKKTHLLYSVISLCAVAAYCGFIVKNSISRVNTVEETLPYFVQEEFDLPPEVTEPTVREAVTIQKNVAEILPKEEAPTSVATEEPSMQPTFEGFSPILPAEGTVTKNFSLKHVYNPSTDDWRAHTGIDITASLTDAVFAVEDGTVTACYQDPLWGNVIEIDHGEYVSIYKNLSTLIMVKEGDSVTRGEKISGAGQSAACEKGEAHVHFEMRHYGEYTDPLELIG